MCLLLMVLGLFACSGLLWMLARQPAVKPDLLKVKSLEVQEIVVTDADGKAQGRWGLDTFEQEGTSNQVFGIFLYGANLSNLVTLTAQGPVGSELRLGDEIGQSCSLGTNVGGYSRLSLENKKSKMGLSLYQPMTGLSLYQPMTGSVGDGLAVARMSLDSQSLDLEFSPDLGLDVYLSNGDQRIWGWQSPQKTAR